MMHEMRVYICGFCNQMCINRNTNQWGHAWTWTTATAPCAAHQRRLHLGRHSIRRALKTVLHYKWC